jgi:hypothetical protein
MFARCAAAALLGAIIALLAPRAPGYSPLLLVTAEPAQWRSGQAGVNRHDGAAVNLSGAAQPAATGSGLPPMPRPPARTDLGLKLHTAISMMPVPGSGVLPDSGHK